MIQQLLIMNQVMQDMCNMYYDTVQNTVSIDVRYSRATSH